MSPLRAWAAWTAAGTVVLGLALGQLMQAGQVSALRAELHQARAIYVQQEANDRQAVRGLSREISRAAERVIRACVRTPALCSPQTGGRGRAIPSPRPATVRRSAAIWRDRPGNSRPMEIR